MTHLAAWWKGKGLNRFWICSVLTTKEQFQHEQDKYPIQVTTGPRLVLVYKSGWSRAVLLANQRGSVCSQDGLMVASDNDSLPQWPGCLHLMMTWWRATKGDVADKAMAVAGSHHQLTATWLWQARCSVVVQLCANTSSSKLNSTTTFPSTPPGGGAGDILFHPTIFISTGDAGSCWCWIPKHGSTIMGVSCAWEHTQGGSTAVDAIDSCRGWVRTPLWVAWICGLHQ